MPATGDEDVDADTDEPPSKTSSCSVNGTSSPKEVQQLPGPVLVERMRAETLHAIAEGRARVCEPTETHCGLHLGDLPTEILLEIARYVVGPGIVRFDSECCAHTKLADRQLSAQTKELMITCSFKELHFRFLITSEY